MHPLQPAAPLVLQHTSSHLLVCWSLPRSHGAAISGFELRHKRTLMSKHPDETDSDPEAPAERTPFNGPMGRVKVYKPARSKWRLVPIPDFVKNATRVQEPFTKDDITSGGRDIDLVTGVKMSLKQQELAYEGLKRGRQWAYSIIGPFKPCSRHQFTVQV